jgi:putative tricarboxylic transport membrane protein
MCRVGDAALRLRSEHAAGCPKHTTDRLESLAVTRFRVTRARPSRQTSLWVACAASLATCAVAAGVSADPVYPHLRIIAPAAPGGGWDQTARAMQQVLQAEGIVTSASVENITGAAGTIGLARFISAERGKADVTMLSGLIMLGAVVTHRSPVTLREVTPIARLTGEYEVVVVPAQSPYRSLDTLLAAFRARPESIAWGGGSAGGTDQILAGLIADAVGVSPRRVNYIAFSGGGESMAAILGGQVAVGINGLAEFASHIAANTVRVLAISSAERLPGVDAPTLREQGVDVVLENWRSLVGPPAMSDADRARLERAVAAMVQSATWHETLRRYRWNDRYLSGEPFARFVAEEEARVEAILERLGTGAGDTAESGGIGRYPLFVIAGFALTAAAFMITVVGPLVRGRHKPGAVATAARDDHGMRGSTRALGYIALAVLLNLALLERAGFVMASIPLFWLTARAFDARYPLRDAIFAMLLSLGAYLLFSRLLQIALPGGVLARWL